MADGHDYCACQVAGDLNIAESATQRVLDNHPKDYAWGMAFKGYMLRCKLTSDTGQEAGGIWYGHSSGLGPRFGGAYVSRILRNHR